MIIREFYETRPDGVKLYKTYSDQGMKIRQETGAEYDEAIDVENTTHTYEETDTPIVQEELTDTQALNIIMGRGMNYGLPNGNDLPQED